MIYFGVFFNVIMILIGGVFGLLIKNKLKEKYTDAMMLCIGIFVLILGVQYTLKSVELIHVLISLIIGVLIGEFLKLDDLLNKSKEKFTKEGSKSLDGLIICIILFCVGSMTITGCLESALNNDHSMLITKAIMDMIAIISISAIYGRTTLFSALFVLIYQGFLVLLFQMFSNFFNETIINQINGVGGFLLIILSFNLLKIKTIKTVNFLPSFIIIVILTLLFL